jgi:(1->4)-alpha-D-glucan 1-alpha-D-glucosylmutase
VGLGNTAHSPTLYSFLSDRLLLRREGTAGQRREHSDFALRFQQLTGPIMAKAVEDTAFYRYSRLICRNEVGDSPGKFAMKARELHQENERRARSWPLSMVTTSTHDTKRGEDASARIAALSEAPELWASSVKRLREIATPLRQLIDDRPAPEPSLEYLLYQTLVGVWPFGADSTVPADLPERLAAFSLKAAREAKTETSWLTGNADYEAAVTSFARGILDNRIFVAELTRLCAAIDRAGASNALGQALMRLCVPGIPDTYQGGELWNQSLVDPDNRRPVDYPLRRRYLADLRAKLAHPRALAQELVDTYADGRIKLYVTHVALQLRRAKPDLFAQGEYQPLDAGEHAVAFSRTLGTERVVCVVPRFTRTVVNDPQSFALGRVWSGQAVQSLDPGRYRNAFTDEVSTVDGGLPLAQAFADFPVGLFVREPV